MNGGQSQSDRILIDAFNAAIEARAKTALQMSLNKYDDGELDRLDDIEFYARKDARDALSRAGINPNLLAEILL